MGSFRRDFVWTLTISLQYLSGSSLGEELSGCGKRAFVQESRVGDEFDFQRLKAPEGIVLLPGIMYKVRSVVGARNELPLTSGVHALMF